MIGMALKIAKRDVELIVQHGEQTYPHECCGVLLGEQSADGNKLVQRVVRCTNTHADPSRDYFSIAPLELMRIEREADDQGHSILGFYHSHPDWPARWSDSDLEEAHWTGCSYVITSVLNGKATETRSFELQGEEEQKCFVDEELQIEDCLQNS